MHKAIIAILFDNYGPYHYSRVSSFQQLVKSAGWTVEGIELNKISPEYAWKAGNYSKDLTVTFVSKGSFPRGEGLLKKISKIKSILSEIDPSILVICGYANSLMQYALWWAVKRKKIAILMSESKENDSRRNVIIEKIKSCLIKKFDASLVGGKIHIRYLTKLGAARESIFLGYDVVDNEIFSPTNIRDLACPLNKPYFLAVNRFIAKKNLLKLISAYADYRQLVRENAWDLVLVGEGDQREQLEAHIHKKGIQDSIHLTGFLQQAELLPYFAHAKYFVHASTQEQWGLVINEAMAAGLPVVVSNRCGCFDDLVREGVNGFGFNPENQSELTNLMIKMNSDKVDLKSMGEASLAHIQKYSPSYFAQGLKKAIDYATSRI